MLAWIILVIFALTYAFLCFGPGHKAKGVWVGILLMMVARMLFADQDAQGAMTLGAVLTKAISWNVLGVLAGAMLIADLFLESGVPVLLADRMAEHCRSTHWALLAVCAFAGAVSAFVDNVTTVLLVTPIALAIVHRTGVNPVPLMVGIAVSANLQGAATLIGDPPSMLMAGYLRLGFNDFFVYQGKPSIFFAIQIGAIAGGAVLYWCFRQYRAPMAHLEVPAPKTWAPVGIIALMIAFLASTSKFDPGFLWLAGTGNVILGILAFLWYRARFPQDAAALLKRYNYGTIFFLAGIFVLAYAMDRFGWVQEIADGIAGAVGDNRFMAYTLIVWVSVLVSAFVDNIAYVALMLPVTRMLETSVGGSAFLYAAGLLVGACLGGNITPIGASCNVVACGVLEREGHPVTFWQFARIGLPFTIAATLFGYLFIWFVWGA
jgi:Na+/H+ antiporter NhaD/arsenite permease-like protein